MRRKFLSALLALLFLPAVAAGQASAAEFSLTVTNLTHGTWFTPLLVTLHDRHTDLFETGVPATAALQAMAEGGDISGLLAYANDRGADSVENPAGGLLAPGASATAVFSQTHRFRNRYLSIVAMLLPTNDGFVGLDSLRLPRIPGTYTYYLNGYDAGTETNDEIVNGAGTPGEPGIPADPGGYAGTGASGVIDFESNSTVHVHRGVLGEPAAAGGSDLDSAIHRWQNPVAKVVIEVNLHRRR
jgi:hypothetical protein